MNVALSVKSFPTPALDSAGGTLEFRGTPVEIHWLKPRVSKFFAARTKYRTIRNGPRHTLYLGQLILCGFLASLSL